MSDPLLVTLRLRNASNEAQKQIWFHAQQQRRTLLGSVVKQYRHVDDSLSMTLSDLDWWFDNQTQQLSTIPDELLQLLSETLSFQNDNWIHFVLNTVYLVNSKSERFQCFSPIVKVCSFVETEHQPSSPSHSKDRRRAAVSTLAKLCMISDSTKSTFQQFVIFTFPKRIDTNLRQVTTVPAAVHVYLSEKSSTWIAFDGVTASRIDLSDVGSDVRDFSSSPTHTVLIVGLKRRDFTLNDTKCEIIFDTHQLTKRISVTYDSGVPLTEIAISTVITEETIANDHEAELANEKSMLSSDLLRVLQKPTRRSVDVRNTSYHGSSSTNRPSSDYTSCELKVPVRAATSSVSTVRIVSISELPTEASYSLSSRLQWSCFVAACGRGTRNTPPLIAEGDLYPDDLDLIHDFALDSRCVERHAPRASQAMLTFFLDELDIAFEQQLVAQSLEEFLAEKEEEEVAIESEKEEERRTGRDSEEIRATTAFIRPRTTVKDPFDGVLVHASWPDTEQEAYICAAIPVLAQEDGRPLGFVYTYLVDWRRAKGRVHFVNTRALKETLRTRIDIWIRKTKSDRSTIVFTAFRSPFSSVESHQKLCMIREIATQTAQGLFGDSTPAIRSAAVYHGLMYHHRQTSLEIARSMPATNLELRIDSVPEVISVVRSLLNTYHCLSMTHILVQSGVTPENVLPHEYDVLVVASLTTPTLGDRFSPVVWVDVWSAEKGKGYTVSFSIQHSNDRQPKTWFQSSRRIETRGPFSLPASSSAFATRYKWITWNYEK